MLVLSRRKDESIMIGEEVQIMIVGIRGDKIRVGITAPKSISVHRKEVYEDIHRQGTDKTK
ncbi:MAG: carbon storage regulator CsrA [Planctomycetota bacterium]|jgi:carbon storage regulator